jgi:MFS family permease
MPFGFGAMIGIAVLGRNFLPRFGKWVLVAGGVVMLISVLVILAGIGLWQLPWTVLVLPLVLAGLGMGSLSGCITPVTLAQVDKDHAGAASGMLKTSQQIGGAIGIALNGSVYFALAGKGLILPSLAAGMVIAVVLAITTVLALRLPGTIFLAEPARNGAA